MSDLLGQRGRPRPVRHGQLRDGSFDHLALFIELHLRGNDIRLVEQGVWESQLARDPAVSRLLFLDMTGSDSVCTLALGDVT